MADGEVGVGVVGVGVVGVGVVVGMVKGGGVGEGAMVVVETTASPGGEERGDDESPGADATIIAYIHKNIILMVLWYNTYHKADYEP